MRYMLLNYLAVALVTLLYYVERYDKAESDEAVRWAAGLLGLVFLTIVFIYKWFQNNDLVKQQLDFQKFAARTYDAELLVNGESAAILHDKRLDELLSIQMDADEAFPGWRTGDSNTVRLSFLGSMNGHVDRIIHDHDHDHSHDDYYEEDAEDAPIDNDLAKLL